MNYRELLNWAFGCFLGVTFDNTTNKSKDVILRNTKESNITGQSSINLATLQYAEMQLMNKPVFILSADNVQMNIVRGTNDGRIFLGGQDGCLYEIVYQAGTSWFGKRCKKINHSHNFISNMLPNIWNYFSVNKIFYIKLNLTLYISIIN